ncbi:MAG: SMI1/KNR4 family protein [Lachnospiraceae bacterium]|nr:SMI1/KNR4 family protein [Lachnospiraceae bacterium]
MITLISKKYDGNIILNKGLDVETAELARNHLPAELLHILEQSNGIEEGMVLPDTGKLEPVSWIIYSYEMIVEENEFFQNIYSVEGIVFSDDGAGNPYYIKDDGRIYCFEACDDEEILAADSLEEFFR